MDRDLPGLCPENLSLDPHNIADVIFLKILIALLADIVSCHICLNIPLQILYITEGGFSHHTLEHHSTSNTDSLSFQFFKMIFNLLAVFCYLIFGDLKRIFAIILQIL